MASKTLFQLIAEANGISTEEGSMPFEDIQAQLADLGLQDSFPPSGGVAKLTPKTLTKQFVEAYSELKVELEIYIQVLIAEVVSGKTSMFTVDNENIIRFKDQFSEKFLDGKTDEEKLKALNTASKLLRYKPRGKVEQLELVTA